MNENEIDRRKFIVNGAGAALGLSVLGKRGFSASPNGTIRVAVVGVNGRGTDHLSGFTPLKGVEVAAICDIDENVLNKRLGEYEKKNGKRPKGYNDMRRVFDDKEIDVVSFATPNHWHSLGTIWACQAGKDVYVEKPLSHNIWEGRKLVEASQKYKRIVQHGTQCRSSQALIEAVQKLNQGVIGKVYMAKGLCYKWRDTIGRKPEASVPAGVNYDQWLGPAPAAPVFTQSVSLQLALALGYRKWRYREPGRAPDGHRALGTGSRSSAASASHGRSFHV